MLGNGNPYLHSGSSVHPDLDDGEGNDEAPPGVYCATCLCELSDDPSAQAEHGKQNHPVELKAGTWNTTNRSSFDAGENPAHGGT